jgi:hypothetical protein
MPKLEPSGETEPELPAAALSIITTEQFALQGARSATISESTGRAGMFLSAASGGLVALGLIATATRVGTAFYAFGLALLPTLALIGLMTFHRVLQSSIEDHGYARRISRLRGFYFERLPALTSYMPPVPAEERLSAHGLSRGRLQGFLTAAGHGRGRDGGASWRHRRAVVLRSFQSRVGAGAERWVAVAVVALFGPTEYQRVAWARRDRGPDQQVQEGAR